MASHKARHFTKHNTAQNTSINIKSFSVLNYPKHYSQSRVTVIKAGYLKAFDELFRAGLHLSVCSVVHEHAKRTLFFEDAYECMHLQLENVNVSVVNKPGERQRLRSLNVWEAFRDCTEHGSALFQKRSDQNRKSLKLHFTGVIIKSVYCKPLKSMLKLFFVKTKCLFLWHVVARIKRSTDCCHCRLVYTRLLMK